MSGNKIYGIIPEDRLTGRGILRTLFMPEIKLGLGSIGMTHRAFISVIATMFIQSGLLPYNHPARNMNTVGKYGIRDLIGESWYNLRQGRGDVQQWGLFVSLALLFGMAILSVMLVISKFLISFANAAVFSSPYPDTDLGLKIIHNLIGKAAYRADGATAAEIAMGDLLAAYSYGVLVIAAFIVGWAILSIVVDTAATGRFFGGRHNPVWWPIRLVFALGILVPLGTGFNAGQLMVIEVAKWGSNLASYAWSKYTVGLFSEAFGPNSENSLIVKHFPSGDAVSHIKGLTKMYICLETNNTMLVDTGFWGSAVGALKRIKDPFGTGGGPVDEANKLVYKFGNLLDGDKCGTIEFRKFDESRSQPVTNSSTFSGISFNIFGGASAQVAIYDQIRTSYISSFVPFARELAQKYVASRNPASGDSQFDRPFTLNAMAGGPPDIVYANTFIAGFFTPVQTRINTLRNLTSQRVGGAVDAITRLGWPGASLWYYMINSANEEISSVSTAIPAVDVPGVVLDWELGLWERMTNDPDEEKRLIAQYRERYMSGFEAWWEEKIATPIKLQNDPTSTPSSGTSVLKRFVTKDSVPNETDINDGTGTIAKFLAKTEIGTMLTLAKQGIADKSSDGSGAAAKRTHPIIFMAEIGRLMIWLATGIILTSLTVGVAAGLISAAAWGFSFGPVIMAASNMLTAILLVVVSPLMIGGIVISIILPMMPFIRFVFAISSWMIAILEAIVMVPVIAIGHLRTDGEGLIGPSLQSAYVMLLQLLLRPVLILIGLIMSMALVEVTVDYVNQTYWAMVDSLPVGGGLNPVNYLIRFVGFMAMYCALVYALINSSFKIVDLFPEAVVKFLGTGASGGLQDREDGSFNSAILASAVFASGAGQALSSGDLAKGVKETRDNMRKPKAAEGDPDNNKGNDQNTPKPM